MERSPLELLWSEDQSLIASTVDEFARDRVAPQHEALDHAGAHPDALWAELSELGLLGVPLPEDLGGAGAGYLAQVLAVEGLARAGGLVGALVCAQGAVVDAVALSGDEEAQGQWLEELATGGRFGAPALMESAPGRVTTTAEGDGPSVRVRGTKLCVPFPGRPSLLGVLARRGDDDVLVAIPGDAAGVRHEAEAQLGFHGVEAGPLTLEGAEGRVLLEGDGLAAFVADLRISVAALLCGVSRGALDHGVRYGGERAQFKRPIRDFPAVQERLVDGDARVEALRGLVHGAARLKDVGQPFHHAARRARVLAAEVAPRVTHDALQVFGGYGVSREYPAERFYRDALFPGFGEISRKVALAESMAALES